MHRWAGSFGIRGKASCFVCIRASAPAEGELPGSDDDNDESNSNPVFSSDGRDPREAEHTSIHLYN